MIAVSPGREAERSQSPVAIGVRCVPSTTAHAVVPVQASKVVAINTAVHPRECAASRERPARGSAMTMPPPMARNGVSCTR